jgi:NAD(P)-dependent dehydrogenase (short-subunit alcohol dehydrogenase family)
LIPVDPKADEGLSHILDLSGRTALITGGSRGVGFAIARRFVEAGGSVIIVARDQARLEEARKSLSEIGSVAVYSTDVGNAESVKRLCAALEKDTRQIDILINNAGTSNRGPFEQLTDENWQSDFDLKLFSAIRLSRFVLPGMKARRWGRILNVVSINGKVPGAEGAPTCVSRAAGIAMSKVMANEFAPHNVLVNALCTGIIMSDQIVNRHRKSGSDLSFEEYAKLEAAPIPLGRIGKAEEYANVALFLASEAGSYVTGAAINIDGGLCKVV